MSSRTEVVMAGVFAAAIALAAIVGAVYFLPSPTQQGKNSSSASGTSPGNQGNLAVLLTDPPTVPAGVTAIYVTYSNVAVHVAHAGNQSGWTNANATGTINLMQMVNVSSTIATVKVDTGVYNALRFNVSSAKVTYNGANYTAFVPRALLTVIIPGGIQVNSTTTAGAIIDMHPTVLNIGSRSTPEFIVNTAASAYGLPPGIVTRAIERIGTVMRIDDKPWWQHINEQYTSNIQITSASVTSSSLSVTIKNTGTQPVSLDAVTVAPVGSECGVAAPTNQRMLPLCFTGSAVFLVQNDSSLKSVSAFVFPPVIRTMMSGLQMGDQNSKSNSTSTIAEGTAYPGSTGYALAPSQSVTLTYSGSISFGFAFAGRTPPGVLSGDQYSITALGQEALAETVVVAG